MKFVMVYLGLLLAFPLWGQQKTPVVLPFVAGSVADALMVERLLLDEQLKENAVLRRAKFYLLQGQVELARYELNSFSKVESTTLNPVVIRYRAVADFLQNRWDMALKQLEEPVVNRSPYFARICVLKVLSKIATRTKENLVSDWGRCQAENPADTKVSDMLWMDTIVRLMSVGKPGIAEETIKRFPLRNLDNEVLKRVVKLALFLNVEGLIVDSIDELDYSVASDEELRALFAHVFFRQGKLARAWKFIEGDTGVNVENIRGNIWLLRGNLEIAFAHFNLALQIKNNSHNAAERALPVAWVLKQWKRGQELTELMDSQEGNKNQLQALATAFAIQMDDYATASKRLERLNRGQVNRISLEVDQLSSYVGLQTKNTKMFVKHAERACDVGDMTACWSLMAHMNWEDLTPLLTNAAPSTPSTHLARQLASNDMAEAFVEEEVYIDQRDIDELDEANIKLIKN